MPVVTTTPPERTGADPRPELAVRDDAVVLVGSRCHRCGHPMATSPPRCPVCGHEVMAPADFGPAATVFSSTVLRIPVPGRPPPFTLAYVDVDDGPRILAHVHGPDEALVPGCRVRLAGWNGHGDPVVTRTTP
ncbi:Zn-ribbon domain-containing OB-fold protein [Candidatus Poriferisocius sp.]|uniref:Zn-ribbon domain-containing OB-fold protein n=1 Tax=Candidatus Poriferisocius sp. TaxID=3101276 RepID=UPI003B5AAC93